MVSPQASWASLGLSFPSCSDPGLPPDAASQGPPVQPVSLGESWWVGPDWLLEGTRPPGGGARSQSRCQGCPP